MPIPLNEIVDRHTQAQNILALDRCTAAGMDQLARKIGVNYQKIQKYETGRNRVSPSKLVEINDGLDTSVTLFFDGVPEKENRLGDLVCQNKIEAETLCRFRNSPAHARNDLFNMIKLISWGQSGKSI